MWVLFILLLMGTTYVSYLFDLFLIDGEFSRKITGAAHLCYMRKIINRLMMNRKKENDSYRSDSIQSFKQKLIVECVSYLIGLTAYRYITCVLYIILIFFHRIRIWYQFFREINNKKVWFNFSYSSLFNTKETKTLIILKKRATQPLEFGLS